MVPTLFDRYQHGGNDMSHKLSFLGLGVMGHPMAGHLARAGHRVTVYNRSPEKARAWLAEHGAGGGHAVAGTPAAAVGDAEIVLACVRADPDLREICLGPDGAFDAMAPGAIFVDHSTVSADLARELAGEAAARGLGFLDAPVSGGDVGARKGTLTVMVGGEEEIFERARPAMTCYGRTVRRLGPVGAGQTAKMANQVCIAGTVQGLAEALHLAIDAGLDVGELVEVLSGGAAQSWQMDNRASTMAKGDFDFGFAVELMRKDLAIVLDHARRHGLSLPLTALVDQFYADVENKGGGRQDTSSLLRRLRD